MVSAVADSLDVPTSLAEIDALHQKAEQLYAAARIEEARRLFERTLAGARLVGDSTSMARSLTWLSQAAWRLGDHETARMRGEQALAIMLQAGDGAGLFRGYNILGLVAWNESRPLDAIDYFGRAASAAGAISDTLSLAKVWNNHGLVATSLGQYGQAREDFEAARRAAQTMRDRRIEGRALINLGMLDLEVGSPGDAVRWFEASRPLLEVAGDLVGEQVLLSHLGTAYAALGDPGRAIAQLDSALQRARANGLRQEEAINLEQLAELHREAGDHRRALDLFARAKELNREMGLVDEEAIDLRSEAQIHAELGDLPLALDKARQAVAIHRQAGFPLEEVRDLVRLAELSAKAGWADSAATYLSAARSVARHLDAGSARVAVSLGTARVARELGRPRRVLSVLAEARSDLMTRAYATEWEAEGLRTWAFAQLGALDSAVAAGNQAIDAVERMRLRYGSGTLRASHVRAREETYSSQVTVLLRMGRVGEAFETAVRAKGRSLLDRLLESRSGLHGRAAAAGLQRGEELLRRIGQLAERIDEIESVPPEQRRPAMLRQAARLRAELEAGRAEYAATVVRAADTDPGGAALLGEAPVDWRQIQASIRPDEALVEYVLIPDGVLAFVLTNRSLSYFKSQLSRRGLASRVRVARSTLGSPEVDPAALDGALARLHEALVGPVRRSAALEGVTRLLVVADGELTYLPFAALWNAPAGRYLVEDFVVSHLPAASLLPVLRSSTPSEGSSLVVLAPFPGALPGTRVELYTLSRTIQGASTWMGREATEARLRRSLSDGGVVHVATHGRLNPRNPMFSRIDLADGGGEPEDDGRLEVHEVFSLQISSPLVFLSGCETGLGPEWATSFDRGEEYSNLARAFLYAGARSVIATLWPVRDRSASRFAETFYLGMNSLDAAGALAGAQRTMIADSLYGAPFHWAAYRLNGRSDLRLTAQ